MGAMHARVIDGFCDEGYEVSNEIPEQEIVEESTMVDVARLRSA